MAKIIRIPHGFGKKVAKDTGYSYTTVANVANGTIQDETMIAVIKTSLEGLIKIDKIEKLKALKTKHQKIIENI